jgi:hypothetical protein
MRNETATVFAEPLLAWTYSSSFPLGIAALIYMRLQFGYGSPFFTHFGMVLLIVGLVFLTRDIFLPRFHAYSPGLRRQSIYSNIWISLIGVWLYGRLFGDFGLVLLIAIALPLWPLSHSEVVKLKRRSIR